MTASLTKRSSVRQLYLIALSREPEPPEVQTSLAHITNSQDRTTALEDVAWPIINSKEFLFRH